MAEQKVSRNEYGNAWPFVVDQGVLRRNSNIITFLANGKEYALNRIARGWKTNGQFEYLNVVEIWRDDPQFINAKVGVDALIKRALQMEG